MMGGGGGKEGGGVGWGVGGAGGVAEQGSCASRSFDQCVSRRSRLRDVSEAMKRLGPGRSQLGLLSEPLFWGRCAY